MASPQPLERPPTIDLVLLIVAVGGISSSAPLIRQAAAPSLALAFWRNSLGVAGLLPLALVSPSTRRELAASTREGCRLSSWSGVLLGAHFALWVPSLSYTSVASSTALVATQPVWAALLARSRGEHVPRLAWIGIAVAISGAVLVSGFDLQVSARAGFGDLLAVAGGALAAAYVTVGSVARRSVGATTHTIVCFSGAAAVLLVGSLAARQPLGGYPSRTWWYIIAITVLAQLLGHAIFSRVLRTTSATVVSVFILFEVVGASILAWAWFGETPPVGVWPGAALTLIGIALVVLSSPRSGSALGGELVELPRLPPTSLTPSS